ncbi:MAG TPA: DUF1707 domain-containing protein [Nocardioides sp.]
MTELRLSDAERADAAEVLADHHAAGRLDVEEHEQRVAAVWAARHASELRPVFDDLPAPHPAVIGGTPARRGAVEWNAPRQVAAPPRRPPGHLARRTWVAALVVVFALLLGLTATGQAVAVLVLLPVATVLGFVAARRIT